MSPRWRDFLVDVWMVLGAVAVLAAHGGPNAPVRWSIGALGALLLSRWLWTTRRGDVTPEPARAPVADGTHAPPAVQELAAGLSTAATLAAAESADVARQAAQLSGVTSAHAASSTEITAAMEELSISATKIAAHVREQAALAETAEAHGVNGAAAVASAVEDVAHLQGGVAAIAERADALAARSNEVYLALDEIAEIALQTHVLSLNAAIEAARAGEQGCRLGVVAEQVGSLAGRARQSVDSARSILEEFTAALRAMLLASAEAGGAAATVLERTRVAASAIAAMRDRVAECAVAAQSIALVASEQEVAAADVLDRLHAFAGAVRELGDGISAVAAAAENGERQALDLYLACQIAVPGTAQDLRARVANLGREVAASPGLGAALVALRTFLRERAGVALAYATGADGRLRLIAAGDAAGRDGRQPVGALRDADLSLRPWYQRARSSAAVIVARPYQCLLGGGECFSLAVRLLDREARFDGVVAVDIPVRDWAAAVAATTPRLGSAESVHDRPPAASLKPAAERAA